MHILQSDFVLYICLENEQAVMSNALRSSLVSNLDTMQLRLVQNFTRLTGRRLCQEHRCSDDPKNFQKAENPLKITLGQKGHQSQEMKFFSFSAF